jgi:hypothetical protein
MLKGVRQTSDLRSSSSNREAGSAIIYMLLPPLKLKLKLNLNAAVLRGMAFQM